MRHTWKNAPHLRKCGNLAKTHKTKENAAHLKKCTTLKKIAHTWINGPHLRKCATLKKMWHTWKNAPHLRGYGTLKYGDVHEKLNFLEIQDLRPLRTCQKHFETILPNFLPDECEI